jgi:hypothetical protein
MSAEEPKSKKPRTEDVSDEEDSKQDDEDGSTAAVEAQQNEQGESFFDLTKSKRVTVRDFKGKTYVDIREVRIL